MPAVDTSSVHPETGNSRSEDGGGGWWWWGGDPIKHKQMRLNQLLISC